jgi:uncharacterized protein
MTLSLLLGTLGASIVGSLHCIAMCGPLVGLHGGAQTMRLAFVHSLGRLATYVTLGVLAGLVGSVVDLAGNLGNVQRAATILAALAIVGLGSYQIAGKGRTRATSRFAHTLVRIRPKSATSRSFMIGTLTGLLPCGWLWAFVIAAAGTGSVIAGGVIMFTFWFGTVPAMVGLFRITGPLLARMRARMPALTAIALIAIGLGTLALRWRDIGERQVRAPHCHHHGTTT